MILYKFDILFAQCLLIAVGAVYNELLYVFYLFPKIDQNLDKKERLQT